MYRTSLVAQRLKHLPTMRETWVQSLGGEIKFEERSWKLMQKSRVSG